MTCAENDGLKGLFRHHDWHLRVALETLGQAPEHRATAHEIHASGEKVLRQLGWCNGQAAHHRLDHLGHHLVDGFTYLSRRQHHRLRQSGDEVTALHFGVAVLGCRHGAADRNLDLLRRALTDRQAMCLAHVRLNRRIDVETSHAHCFERHDSTKTDHGGLGRSTTDVDDHVAHRLVDR